MDVEHIKSARKRHGCDWCGEAIEIGKSYSRYRYLEPEYGFAKMHPECFTAMQDAYSDEAFMRNIEDGFTSEQPRGCYHDPIDKDCDRCRK